MKKKFKVGPVLFDFTPKPELQGEWWYHPALVLWMSVIAIAGLAWWLVTALLR